MKKKILCLLLALLVINLSIPHVAWATESINSGYCGAEGDGKNVQWNLDSDGTLTISGLGKMKDYNTSLAPWRAYLSSIKSVIIKSSVTSIGIYAFWDCTSLQSVTIPGSVTSIGDNAFVNCTSLQSVTIPENVTSIGMSAFENCTSLKSVTIPKDVKSIGILVFYSCYNLKTVFYNSKLFYTEDVFSDEVTLIAYEVNDQQDGSRTKVKLVNTSENVTIKCDAMGDRYEIIDNGTTREDKKVTIEHYLPDTWDEGDGEKHWRVCTVCGAKEAAVHDWNAGTVTKNPTCIEDGTKSYTCNACGAMKDETIKAAEHKFSPEWSSNDTHHWHECSACYEKQNEEKHTFEQKSDEGKHWEECNVCHEKQNEGQHTFEQKSDSTKHWKVCSICKEVTERGRHNFIEDTIGAMENKLGGTKCTCTDCGYVYWKDFKRGGKNGHSDFYAK